MMGKTYKEKFNELMGMNKEDIIRMYLDCTPYSLIEYSDNKVNEDGSINTGIKIYQ